MMRITLFFITLLLLTSCGVANYKTLPPSTTKNTAVTTSDKVYAVIDTTKLYRLVARYYKYDKTKTNVVSQYNYKKYLKFYQDGRLAVFDEFDLNAIDTLRAQKTDQGHYEYKHETLYTKNYLTNKDGKQFYNPQSHKRIGDTLSLYSQSTKDISYYIPLSIPESIFVEKASW